jgi:hypothetical protein
MLSTSCSENRLEGTQQPHRARGRGVHDETVRTDRPRSRSSGRQVANTLAELIIGRMLATTIDGEGQGAGAA